jgi:hypothetical protein
MHTRHLIDIHTQKFGMKITFLFLSGFRRQIIAVDGVSLVNLSYAEALKLLQSAGRIVELVLSQVYQPNRQPIAPSKPSPAKAKSMQNIFNKSLNDINVEFDQIDRAVKNMNLYDGQYYRNADAGRHYQAEIVNFMKQLQDQERDGGLSLSNQNLTMTPRVAESENFKLTPSKSMPDLPKVRHPIICPCMFVYVCNRPPSSIRLSPSFQKT